MFDRTIDDIIAGLSTMGQQLITLADKRAEKTVEYTKESLELDNKANVARAEGARALRIAKKLEDIIS